MARRLHHSPWPQRQDQRLARRNCSDLPEKDGARYERSMRCTAPGFGEGGVAFASDMIKALMRKIVLALIVAVLPTWVAAQQSNQSPKHSPKARTLHPAGSNPCAKYGVGFAKIAGSDTCIKIGGSVDVEAGGRSRR